MIPREIRKGIYAVGAIDWDREFFDELIPLPDGTSYNSYLVKGKEKTALIDTVDADFHYELFQALTDLMIDDVDYIVIQHVEQDHSGTLPDALEMFPDAKVLCSKKAADLLKTHLHIEEEKIEIVEDGQKVDLGGKSLEFIMTAWVHWPDTMCTYVKEDKTIFTCDFFGSHLATSSLFVDDQAKVYEAAKRYYAEIMMPFANNIKGHLKKLEPYAIDFIAPSHGPVYNRPEFILDAYKEWSSDKVKNEVIIPFISMHESTKFAVEVLTDTLMAHGIKVIPMNLMTTDTGELAKSLVDAATIVIATPTVLTGPHPHVVCCTYLANALRPKTKFLTAMISYGWGSRALDVIKGLTKNMKAELIDPISIKGMPDEDDIEHIEELAFAIYEKHKKLFQN
ncbi:MAG: FprA family A-type flavoprotein [Candidatus Zixiibacteriota bacterium]